MKAYLEIEMPRCCNKCPMLVYEGHTLCVCRALPAIEDDEILKPWKNRRKDCPLIPIQEHGRLIDADAAVANRNADMNWCYDLHDLPDYLSGCPTIIPANEEGE